ncbi:MAG: hypothetical protein H0T54_06010 [Geodermatophilaceae bacterium]|nr:hypothetical protein [Geodermatophilaceae bacterium]
METLTSLPQPSEERAAVLALSPAIRNPATLGAHTTQSPGPILHLELPDQIVGIRWSDLDSDSFAALLETGAFAKPKKLGPDLTRRTVDRMGTTSDSGRREPQIIHRRPGRGGHGRSLSAAQSVDPLEGIEKYGAITWRHVAGGARVGVLYLNDTGNAVCAARLSAEDQKERFSAQIEPNLALARRYSDVLNVRALLLAENMSGTREVRGDREPQMPAHVEGRDDLHLIDEWIEDWCEHVIWRDGDRIARDILQGETVTRRWKAAGVGLWLASSGRKMDYVTDRLALRATNMVSAEERDNSTRRMQMAQITKGPLAGVGWLGNAPFGLMRNKQTNELLEDPEQWPFIMRAFELADAGATPEGTGGLSTRDVASALAEEGCSFDHDRVRRILKDPIYATGEFITTVRGIPIAQGPVRLRRPVPIDRFQRVQDLFALRQARSSLTPIGEYVLNYVDCVHVTCMDHRHATHNWRPKISGVVSRQGSTVRRYKHSRIVIPECKAMRLSFSREQLETPIIREVRRLASHPELLRQLAAATPHSVARTSARMTDDERRDIEREIAALRERRAAAAEEYVLAVGRGAASDLDAFTELRASFTKRMERLARRLDADELLADVDEAEGASTSTRVRDFLEILTVAVPDDPAQKALRAQLFQRCVSRIEIDADAESIKSITLYGHLVPDGSTTDSCNPIVASADLLDRYALDRSNQAIAIEAIVDEGDDAETVTDLSGRASKSVTTLYDKFADLASMESTMTIEVERRERSSAWAWNSRRQDGQPGWSRRLKLSPQAGRVQSLPFEGRDGSGQFVLKT